MAATSPRAPRPFARGRDVKALSPRLSTRRRFQEHVLEAARLYGWRVYVNRRGEAGFPDLVLVREGRLIFVELKGEGGRPAPGQLQWIGDLGAVAENTDAGGAVHVASWRPGDWSEICECLR
jgi:VRR-NUC domain